MIRTAALLILTIIVLPLVAFKFGTPLDDTQWWMLKRSGMAMLGIAMGCFVLSEITRNCSQFDKLWSLLPIGYTWYFAHVSNYEPRVVLMAVLASIWGARLTYNFGRRGGYSWKFWSGEEDYRWEVLRQRPEFKDKKVAWTLFNFFFISIYQNALVWLFSLPPVLAWQAHDKPLGIADYALAAVLVALVITETIADQQQWNFQNKKNSKKKTGEALTEEEAQGFISSGLWAYSRHPNYACEQSIWVVFYLIGALATGMYINWSMAGCLLLVLLFKGSSDFSEEISAGKYPAYKDYQKRVGRFLPF